MDVNADGRPDRSFTYDMSDLKAAGLTGAAAVLNSVRFNQIPSNTGLGLELKVIAAVVKSGKPTSIPPPPRDRLAINTQVVQFSENVIRSAGVP